MNLLNSIQDRFRAALKDLVPDAGPYVAMVKPTQDTKHGDYQANCAMALAKTLGKKPREIAQDIVARLDLGDLLEAPEIAGPGFINLRLQTAHIAGALQTISPDDRLGVTKTMTPRTYVIDYSSPNVAKPLHVGHLRSTIIGDALTRLLRFLGHTVITDNHLGDWGTQFGILLYGYKNLLDQEAYAKEPVRELARIYIEVRRLIGADEDEAKNPIAEACRAETAKLHHGDVENNRLWKEFMPHCLAEIHEVYEKLGILPYDHEHGESFYNPLLPGVVESLLESKVAEPGDAGAIIIRFNENNVALVRKRDGAFTYTTSDLATIQYRLEHFHPQAILYVVDFRQSQHFANLFEAARRWGVTGVELSHISFGSVLGKEGKPISTRKGDGTELIDLINQAVELGLQKYRESYDDRKAQGHEVPDLTDADQRAIAEAVGIGAIKYADLSQNRTSDYKFDYDKMLATEGNTATYMQYAYARNRSIFRKAGIDAETLRTDPPTVTLETPHERALALQLLRFEEALLSAVAEYQPSAITAYLWDLAKTFSGFFQNCPVIRAESEPLRKSRLLLCDLTARVLQRCLDLLGIKTVERM
ncbi:MAG: arginine--tRNA ligase [Planctomycetes bacterium]|nr:arginine--tRNA ligase [Planctomycetota bacterium]